MFIKIGTPEASKYTVRDLDTGEIIRGVQWANDETGEYEVILRNESGSLKYKYIIEDNHMVKRIVKEIRKGNIKIEPKK